MNRFVLCSVLAFMVCSCRDRVDDSNTLPGEFFETPEQAFEAVDKLYHSGAPSFYGKTSTQAGPVAAVGGYLSGYFDNESKSEVPWIGLCQQLTFDGNTLSPLTDSIWLSAYRSIEQANATISNLTGSTKISEQERQMLMAEARFFRVFNYFFLARYFGDIPLLKEGKTWQESSQVPLAEVYRFMIGELQAAIPHLSNPTARISPGAAQALLCDVYLTASGYPLQAHYYLQAAACAKQIIQSGAYRLVVHDSVSAVSAYKMLYNANSPELIYGYTPAAHTFSTLSFTKGASSWGILSKTTNNAYKPLEELLAIYDSELDRRADEGVFFHSFYKYTKGERTVIQSFEHAPCIWLDGGDSLSQKRISLYRFAEVLLVAAEAIAQTEGVTPEAVGYLAQVRARAYHKSTQSDMVAQLTQLDKEQFVEEVWRERLREFPLEMKLWHDMQRTRKYPITEKGGVIKFVDLRGARNTWGGAYGMGVVLLPVSEHIKSENQTMKAL